MRNMKYAICAIIALILGSPGISAAAQQANSIGYAVYAVLPENQADGQVSYFDLNVEPGQHQMLQVVIINRADEEIEVAMEANTAFSNSNGVIEFSHSDDRDASMTVDFAEIVTPVEPVITVPANSEKAVEFSLTVPEEPFEGIAYGGLMFTKLNQDFSEDTRSVAIKNVYRYVIGVRLHESDEAIEPEFELIGGEINETNNQSITIHLRNPRPIIVRGATIQVSVYPYDDDNAVFTFENGHVAIAPNSSMPFTIRLEDEQSLKTGAYRAAIKMQYEGKSWQFETKLTVD